MHPSRVEAVTWISGRTDVMMTLFVVASLLLFWQALQSTERRRLLAVGAWFVAQGEQIYPTTIDAPVDYLWSEPDPGGRRLILMNDKAPPNPVRLQVSGTRAAVNRLRERTRENEVRYVVDLREAQPGPAIHSFLRPPGGVTAVTRVMSGLSLSLAEYCVEGKGSLAWPQDWAVASQREIDFAQ